MAARFLENNGMRIVAKRIRTHFGELDLIAQNGTEWVFVEVKTRSSRNAGLPEEAFTPAKARKMSRAVQEYMQSHHLENEPIRCDVVAIDMEDDTPAIRHYTDVLSGGGLA